VISNILDRIVATKREELRGLAGTGPELRSRAADAPPPRGFAAALRRPGEVRLLAEVKRRSPSAGEIRPAQIRPRSPARTSRVGPPPYPSSLTASTSAVTWTRCAAWRRRWRLPVIRKDFIIDPLQVWEARGAGADAVLLIVRILDDVLLRELHAQIHEMGMDALVEAHNADEVERALAAGATLLGVNNRDLDTFVTDLDLSMRLAGAVPAGVTLVAESGIRVAADVDRLGAAGVDAILVGESLMRQQDLRAAAAALAGRPKVERA
jgi:indole-3-glycerol phosphate synthase